MASPLFNDTNFDASYIAGDFSGIQSAIDTSFNQIKTLCRNASGAVREPNNDGGCDHPFSKGYKSDVDINFIEDVYTFSSELKKKNKEKIDDIKNTLDNIRNNQSSLDFSFNDTNVKNIKDIVNKNKKENSDSIKAFLETYLYLIVKVILIFVLFVLVYNYNQISFFSFSFSELYGKLKNKVNEIKNSGTEIKNNLNNKIKNIKDIRGNKEPPKRNILNTFNNKNNFVNKPVNNGNKSPNNGISNVNKNSPTS